MTRKLGILALAFVWCLGASAAVNVGVIAGTVRDTAGVPQMGAIVEVLSNSAARSQTALTDTKGGFTLPGLLPGLYTIKVTAPSFLPTIRERVHLQSGASLLLNVTLNTLFEAIQLVPRHKPSADGDDDWRWALRSMANRPILRLAEDKPLVVVQRSDDADGQLKARVSFIAGSDGDALSGTDTNFHIEQSMFGKRDTPAKWSLNGGVGSNSTNPNAVIRAAYSREMPDGSFPEIAISAKHFASLNPNQPAIQALALSIANSMTFGESLEVEYGGETQTVQFRERATSYRPFANVSVHPGKNTTVQYRYATSAPNLRRAKGFDTAPADLSESSPRLTLTSMGQRVERASHHEVSVSQRMGKNKVQVAVFSDTIHNAALTGTGAAFTEETDAMIGDPYSGNFSYNGGNLHTQGVRAVYSRPLAMGLDATVDYAYGGALTAPPEMQLVSQTATSLITEKRHSAAAKLSGTTPAFKTKIIASYRWLSGSGLTAVDMFNASAGETDPYLSFFIRQPIPTMHILPAGLEALIDVRNLLAQGYRPVLSSDGSIVYLVQGVRCIRAGLSFNF
ncbi:MAG TPA: TonB-dependent receptor [Candidatus Saccharimonadales bacterium]|nr:TonB-dependent receptor [Candidatus Saccharimonadales bacterium]